MIKDVSDIMVKCKYCGHELGVVYNIAIPFEGHFNMQCPKCFVPLDEKKDFDLFVFESDDKR